MEQSRRWPFFAALGLMVAAILAAAIVVAAGTDKAPQQVAAPTTSSALPPNAPRSSAPSSSAPPAAGSSVWVLCSRADGQDIALTLEPNGEDHYDFAPLWNARAHDCHASGTDDPAQVPAIGPVEQAALKASGFDDGDISPLFIICATNGDETYVNSFGGVNFDWVAELNGALVLCPYHPDAAAWREAIKRGQGDAKLRADGRLFDDGTYLIGDDIMPGTYAVTNVHNCYWERLTSSGQVIDNDLVLDAARVQVTIRATDYRFRVRECGVWRPVN